MSGPSYSSYGTIALSTNVITIPALTAGQIIIIQASSPQSNGSSNLSVSGAGATWNSAIATTGAPLLFCFYAIDGTPGSTSVTLTASGSDVGVGSYIISIWDTTVTSPAQITATTDSNNPTNGVSFVTPSIAYSPNDLLVAGVTAYDDFAGATPPVWSMGDVDNLVQYQVRGAGNRPIWSSWIQPSTSGSTTYTSPYSDSASTGVAVVILRFSSTSASSIVMIL